MNRNSVSRRVATVVLALLLGSTAATATSPAQASPQNSADQTRGYVALGDSYASGEGLAPYEPSSATTDERCHRSVRKSYPELLERSYLRAFNHLTSVACSGAVTTALFATVAGNADEAPQLDALSSQTRTVTLSIGGNDAGFAQVLGNCIHSADPAYLNQVPGKPGCRGRLDTQVSAAIANLGATTPNPASPSVPLPLVIKEIHARAPKAQIYVSGYPQLFGTRFTEDRCAVGTLGPIPLAVTADDARWIRSKADALNAVAAGSVARARATGIPVRFVDIADTFDGHNVCDHSRRWLNAVVITPTPVPAISPASFHPTSRGQLAYAATFARSAERWYPSQNPRR